MNEWFATLIDDLKFLGAECKREFLDLEIRPMTAEEIRRRHDEIRGREVSTGRLQIRNGELTFYGRERNR